MDDVRGGVLRFNPIRGHVFLLSPLLLVTICLRIMPMLLGFQAVSSQLMLTLAISPKYNLYRQILHKACLQLAVLLLTVSLSQTSDTAGG